MLKKNLVIIGSGPAAFTSAIYAARANLKPLVFEGFMTGPVGGQLTTTTDVENFPGFPDGIIGPQLMDNMRAQAIKFGSEMITEDVLSVNLSNHPFEVQSNKNQVFTNSIIIATGATAKRLDIDGSRDGEFWQKGVTACAICDGASPIFRNKDLYVIGGGDSAVEEAIFLTKYANKVYIVHRRDELRASKIMASRALNHPKIEILWNKVIAKIEGANIVNSVIVEDVNTKKIEKRQAGGVFFAIGHKPNTDFLENQVNINNNGYIITLPNRTYTNVEGVFAAGDVQDYIYKQAITAAGSGCMAALDAERWLSEKGFLN